VSRGLGIPVDLPRTSDGRPILWQEDLDAYDPSPRRSGGRVRYYCPIHGGDHQQSLSLNPATGRYKCHTCGEGGTLRDHWSNDGGARGPRRPPRSPTLEEQGLAIRARRAQAEEELAVRLAAELPVQSKAFLLGLPALNAALGAPDCPGANYLRERGLDPLMATSLGVGYAAPNAWLGDQFANEGRGLKSGRVVYPLADPLSGRIVSAVGRLCADPRPSWSDERREEFKSIKQRKLKGCPAGVWPYASLAAARDHKRPLAIVEGPADALALLQRGPLPCEVVALIGTANVLPLAALEGIPGIVLALDADGGGTEGAKKLHLDLALARFRVERLPVDWLGRRVKDPADLAAMTLRDGAAADRLYASALIAVCAACDRLGGAAWDDSEAHTLLKGMYHRLAEAAGLVPILPRWDETWDMAIDTACDRRDLLALVGIVLMCEQDYLRRLAKQADHASNDQGRAGAA